MTNIKQDNREIKPKNIKQLIVEIAEEPFVEDRVIGMIELVKEVKRQSRYKFEGKLVNGNYYQKQSDGTYFSVNSLSKSL
jgi:hypothetical protein